MTRGVTSGVEAYNLADNLEALGFKAREIEGDVLYFNKKVRVVFDGKLYWLKKGKRDPVTANTIHKLVETLTSIGV
jgi:hypothetical protein